MKTKEELREYQRIKKAESRARIGIKNDVGYITEYNKTHRKAYTISFSLTTDKDVIEFLENADSITGVIRDLIREKLTMEEDRKRLMKSIGE